MAHFNKHVEGFFRKDSQGEGSQGWHLYSTRSFLPTDVQPLSLSWKSPSVWRCLGVPQKPASLDRLVSTCSHSFSFWALFAWHTSRAYQPTKLTICEVSKLKTGLTCHVSYCRQFRSLLLHSCDAFWVLINSCFVCWFCIHEYSRPHSVSDYC